MNKRTVLGFATCVALMAAMGVAVSAFAAETFTNPVIAADWPDPAVYDGGDGWYYSVATGLSTIRKSRNLIDWEDTKIDPLAPKARERLHQVSHNVWAPCVTKLGDKWVLYISLFVSDPDCRIAALTSKSPTGPFKFAGEVIDSRREGVENAIDPYVLAVGGRVWMFFGSLADGVHRIELAEDGLSVKPDAKPVHVAGVRHPADKMKRAWEGSYLHWRNGWWYLFVSGGHYGDHTYYLTVGRSRKIDGKFMDRKGRPMTEGLADPILSSDKDDFFYGPGHNGEIFKSADGRDYIFYHSHVRGYTPSERPTLLQELMWDKDGWPCFKDGKPQKMERRFELPAWRNPVWPKSFPDPTTWQMPDGTWRAASTTLGILKSDDFIHWEKTGKRIFTRGEEKRIRKEWKKIWAPDVFKLGDEYRMYVSFVNCDTNSAIAVYSSKSPEGPFTDGRIITRSLDTGIRDTIDPEVVRDDRDGTLWLFFGSTGRMHRVKLAPDGKALAPEARYEHVAGICDGKENPTRRGVFEGCYLHRRSGWWYLFASQGCYWNHTYSIVCGRAKTLDGPFLDSEGRKMTDGFATMVLESKKGNRFFGPGHNGEITTIGGKDYIPYHCHVDGETPKQRPLFVSELLWDKDGWPKVKTMQ